jgi:hypothetical protein
MTSDLSPAEPILSDVPGSFAWGVWNQRHPVLIKQVLEAFPYPPQAQSALEALLEESISGLVTTLPAGAHDLLLWEAWGDGMYGRPWSKVPFLWAESYFYRRLLQCLDYFEPGPWHGVDPFAQSKRAELPTAVVDAELSALDVLDALPLDEQRALVVGAALWGNRADLGFRITAKSSDHGAPEADLVADDSALMWSILERTAVPVVHIVADNAGRELLADLILIDHLLRAESVAEVVLHVKPQPYYVSDANGLDVVDVLRRLTAASGHAADAGHRLWAALNDGTIRLQTHTFWCAPLPFHHLPAELAQELSSASLTILKGDLNYRRLVGDCSWPATAPFGPLTEYFPSPLAALRTLKSDVVVGVDEATLARLNTSGSSWRTDGTHALIQARQ